MSAKETIKTIIKDFHSKKLKESFSRTTDIPINTGIVISIIGARRSGKTYVLYETIKKLIKSGISKQKIIYLNFEDERLKLAQNELDLILQAYSELFPNYDLENCHFFFDEIQNINGWEKFIRRLYDTISRNIYITGSNSKLLSTDIATELRGRTITFTVYPLNFKEFLTFNKTKPDYYQSNNKIKIIQLLREFMKFGGFPELVKQKESIKILKLQDYFNSVIYKDLIERYQISNPGIIKFFLKKIYNNVTKPLSVNKIYNHIKSMGYKIGNNILYDYLDYTQASFAVLTLKKFDFSMLKQEKSEKKAYSIDNGFLSAIDYSLSQNYGKLFENMIALELLKWGKEVMYFKENKECDFIIKDKNKLYALQASYNIDNDDTRKRELEGLHAACKSLKLNSGKIITFEQEEKLTYKGIDIEIVPAYKFMTDAKI